MDVKRKTDCQPAELLRAVPLFQELSPESREELACRVRERTFAPGEEIFHVGDPGDHLFVITEGRVRIELPTDDGPPVVLNVIEPGEFFGELALCDGRPRSASAIAMEAVHTLTLSHADFQDFLGVSPQASGHIIMVLSDRLRQVSDHLAESIFYDTASRLARRLLELAEQEGLPDTNASSAPTPQGVTPLGRSGRTVTITRELTPDDLAEMVGATSERIHQELENLEQDQILTVHGNQITIRSLPLLKERIRRKSTVGPGSVTIPSWLLD
jgi:CRP/FNR family transcriptional regulator